MFLVKKDDYGFYYLDLPFGMKFVRKSDMGVLRRSALALREMGARVNELPPESKGLFPLVPYSTYRQWADKISSIPPCGMKATGEMRVHQLRNTELLCNTIKVLQEAGCHPFLDYGTLLGSVRHGGFVPWDDDVDISIMREEFEPAFQILRESFVEVDASDSQRWQDFWRTIDKALKENPGKILVARHWCCIKIFRGKSAEDCEFVDLFAYDSYAMDFTEEKLADYRSKLAAEGVDAHHPFAATWAINARELGSGHPITPKGDKLWFGVDTFPFRFFKFRGFMSRKDFFPLATMKFEGHDMPVPACAEHHLQQLYGDWRKIPARIDSQHHTVKLD